MDVQSQHGRLHDQILMNLHRATHLPGGNRSVEGHRRFSKTTSGRCRSPGREVIVKINDGMGNLVITGNYADKNGTITASVCWRPMP